MEEVFEKLSAHFIKGMMFHDQMANYYDFLNLRGYKRCHEYQFYRDSIAYRKINRYYINHHSKLIPESEIDDPALIPDSWVRYKREEVDASTKRTAVETGIRKYVEWEKETKEALESSIKTLTDDGYIADACFLKEFLADVDKELKCVMRWMISLKDANYDISYIMGQQDCKHDYYMKKTKELMKR